MMRTVECIQFGAKACDSVRSIPVAVSQVLKGNGEDETYPMLPLSLWPFVCVESVL